MELKKSDKYNVYLGKNCEKFARVKFLLPSFTVRAIFVGP